MVSQAMFSVQVRLTGIVLFLLMICSACQGGQSLSVADNPLMKSTETPLETVVDLVETEPVDVTATPSSEPTPEQSATPTEKRTGILTITIVFDNYPYQEGLTTSWGFSAFVTYKDQNVLFDTGGSGSILLSNMEKLDINPGVIQNVVLSHIHGDHIGGLMSLFSEGAKPKVYLLPSFSRSIKNLYNTRAEVIEVEPGQQIIERVGTTGEIAGSPPEQALVIDTTRGLVVITGCAHPGVDQMVLEAKRQFQEEVYLVVGGFHLGSASQQRVDQIINEFQRLGVEYVAPCHCTGDHAIAQFKDAFGDHFIQVGTGAVIEIET
jgi:7,8-dihydropterin-6-yl-methyl-4-(beta-D-ribofuranosyl)aminobenzene 5'-phosphate synthase